MARPTPIFRGSVDATGKLRLESDSLFRAYVKRLRNCPVTLVLKKATRPKSQSQLGFLFGVVYPIAAEEFGYCDHEIEALHDACMRILRGLRPDPNPLNLRISLADMTHEEVSDYIGDLRLWLLTEYSISTPDADRAEPSRKRTKAA